MLVQYEDLRTEQEQRADCIAAVAVGPAADIEVVVAVAAGSFAAAAAAVAADTPAVAPAVRIDRQADRHT